MMTQNEIAKFIGCSQPTINMIFTGKRPVSWPLAEKLSELFPSLTIQQWKTATPEDLKRAFEQLKTDGEAA